MGHFQNDFLKDLRDLSGQRTSINLIMIKNSLDKGICLAASNHPTKKRFENKSNGRPEIDDFNLVGRIRLWLKFFDLDLTHSEDPVSVLPEKPPGLKQSTTHFAMRLRKEQRNAGILFTSKKQILLTKS